MGEYFIVANPRKRQYVSASHFGGNVKCHCRLQDWAARATGLLIYDCSPREKARLGSLTGSWVGDPVVLAGDYDSPLPEIDPSHNPYEVAHYHYEPVGLRVLAALAANPAWAAEFGRVVPPSVLGYVALYLHSAPLQAALDKKLGRKWREALPASLPRDIHLTAAELLAYSAGQDTFPALPGAFRTDGGAVAARDVPADPGVPPPGPEDFFPLIVNPAKGQYMDPNRVPAGLDRAWPLVGWPGEVLGPWIGHYDGRWMGDPIILAAADAAPNPGGLITATADQPRRNLFEQAWDDFEDVTPARLPTLNQNGR